MKVKDLTGFIFRFDNQEKKTIAVVEDVVNACPIKYKGAEIRYSQNLYTGDIEVLKLEEGKEVPYMLIEVKIKDLIVSRNEMRLDDQLNRLVACPHPYKFLILGAGLNWKDSLYFSTVIREWSLRGVLVYWVGSIKSIIKQVFELARNPPSKESVYKCRVVPLVAKDSEVTMMRMLMQFPGISWDYAHDLWDTFKTMDSFLSALPSDIQHVIQSVENARAKAQERKPNILTKLANDLFNFFHTKEVEASK